MKNTYILIKADHFSVTLKRREKIIIIMNLDYRSLKTYIFTSFMKLSLNYTITHKKKINKLIIIVLSSLSKTFANWSAQYVCIIINYISVHQGRELSSNQVNKSNEYIYIYILVRI